MPFTSHPLDFILRHADAVAMTSIAMVATAIFVLTGAPGQAIQQWKDDQSSVVMQLTGSLLTGATLDVRGTMSGRSLVVGTGAVFGDKDGAGCTTFLCLNGSCTGSVVTCP